MEEVGEVGEEVDMVDKVGEFTRWRRRTSSPGGLTLAGDPVLGQLQSLAAVTADEGARHVHAQLAGALISHQALVHIWRRKTQHRTT